MKLADWEQQKRRLKNAGGQTTKNDRLSHTAAVLIHWNHHRISAVILYTGLAPDDERAGCSRVDKYVSERRLETSKVVREERTVPSYSSVLTQHSQRGVAASSDSIVQYRGPRSETPDFDSRAILGEDGAVRRRQGDIVVDDHRAGYGRHRRRLANQIDACSRCVRPTTIDRIVRNHI
jgi:hypothetical protein